MSTGTPPVTNVYDSLGIAATADAKRKPSQELGQEQFLDLMIAQLKNQDPTKPLESGEFLSQMAQFSTVTGIQSLQESFSQLAASMQSNQALQASMLVGRSVLAPGDKGALDATTPLSGAVDLPASTTALTLNVYDAGGQLVRHLPLGAQSAGLVQFSWDGITDRGERAAPGTYRVRAEALTADGQTGLQTLMKTRVESVSLGRTGEGLTLNLAGLGPVALADVKQIL